MLKSGFGGDSDHISRETKGWFCKRAVLADVPSFRCLGSKNIKQGKILWRKIRYRGPSAKNKPTLSETPKNSPFGLSNAKSGSKVMLTELSVLTIFQGRINREVQAMN